MLYITHRYFKADERYRNLQGKFEAYEQKYDQLLKKSQNNISTNIDGELLQKNITIAQVSHSI